MDDYSTMPAATLDESEEQRKQRLIRSAGGMNSDAMPPASVSPASAPERRLDSPNTMTMPPAGGYAPESANASLGPRTMQPGTREYNLALGATEQPRCRLRNLVT